MISGQLVVYFELNINNELYVVSAINDIMQMNKMHYEHQQQYCVSTRLQFPELLLEQAMLKHFHNVKFYSTLSISTAHVASKTAALPKNSASVFQIACCESNSCTSKNIS